MAEHNALDGVVEALSAAAGVRCECDVSLASWSTYRVGGPTAVFAEVSTIAGLETVAATVAAELAAGQTLDVLMIGRGSNLLVADAGWPGLTLVLSGALSEVTIDTDTGDVRTGGAASLPVVARQSVAAGLTGFEWAVGVPGSMGGAVTMNAGGHGSDMAATLVDIRVVDLRNGQTSLVAAEDLHLRYRHSDVPPGVVIAEVSMQLQHGSVPLGEQTLRYIVSWRREHQPGGANAGSVFTNPDGDSAGRLIDSAGCKGLRRGSAAVSDKHANFIMCDPGGSAHDVFDLMVDVVDRVWHHHGIRLRAETRLAGFDASQLSPLGALAAGARLEGLPT